MVADALEQEAAVEKRYRTSLKDDAHHTEVDVAPDTVCGVDAVAAHGSPYRGGVLKFGRHSLSENWQRVVRVGRSKQCNTTYYRII